MFKMLSVPILLLTFATAPIQADTLLFDLGQTYSGTSPAGPGPWLQALFTQTASNTVTLQLSAVDLAGSGRNGEFVTQWDLNYKGNPSPLTITQQLIGSTVTATSIGKGEDAFHAPGDGLFDIEFLFSTSGANNGSARFTQGKVSLFTITSTGPLAAADFNFLSTPVGGSNGPYYSAAHIQNTPGGSSAQVANGMPAPEPSTYLSLGTLLVLVGSSAARMRRGFATKKA